MGVHSFYRPRRIHTLLVANRGEIALRVIRAARELGMRTVAVYSDADRDALAVRLADSAVHIGPAHATRSYLNADALLAAARDSGADAIHPGYGFLAENADFSQAVTDAGLVFVGPDAHTIRSMGDKAAARACAKAAGVPTVPGSEGVVGALDEALSHAAQIGYPLMIKASAGGGVYLERYLPRARHIEVQVLGDGERAVHLFERECSLQRRRQKVFEEAPSPALSSALRQALCESALRLTESVGYRGAGTLEYLYDETRGEFYFIEMNTRIQVEHPITEAITGIDLVREMLRIADGEPLRLKQSDIVMRGAAIECRLNAEDPARNFAPGPGTVSHVRWPAGPGVRIDSMVYAGSVVPPYYDSLLAKLIVWDESRDAALARMARALDETEFEGVPSTLALHRALVADAGVLAGDYYTNYLESWMQQREGTQ
ncbi:Biotin carboxylase [Achromobacter xylosoxidans]|uniref:ATP-binding protein n=1 Tax=Alcaligenes xylosoxydans xylosoxydans TaxID=85698 RepID=UPI0006C6BB09|nr:biotin carboxylase N-terminal domain-containing protein [Achromobacter xylosoxidans]CUK12668.1 Biotin carboxylase [Achromobacter xylosoxidans]